MSCNGWSLLTPRLGVGGGSTSNYLFNGPPFFSSQNPFGEPLPLRETFLDEWLNVPGKDGIFPKDLSFAPRCRPKKSSSFIFLL